MNIPFSPPDITESEIELVSTALRSGWITTGPKTKEFENKLTEYFGTNKVACLNSATAAMELTLRVLGIGPGDEVITSAYTYTASASVIQHVGAKIVLIDTKENSYEMDYDQLENAITENTKAIIPVDLAGVMCDYDRIYQAVNNKLSLFTPNNSLQEQIGRIAVIADAAHAVGATRNGKNAGQMADFTCFSFHAVKNLTTAEGGAATWKSELQLNDEEIYQDYMILSLHGQSKDALSKSQIGSWEYDIIYPGYKCNMTDIMASIGLVQLQRYPELLERRKNIIMQYNNGFKNSEIEVLQHFTKEYKSSGHLYLTRVKGVSALERNEIIKRLAERGIAANVHYKPLPMMTAYKNMGFDIKNFPNAYNQAKNEITLPLHTKLTDEEVQYIVATYLDIVKTIKE